MDKQDLFEKIKRARLQRYLTNCYSLDVVEHCTNVWQRDDEFIFSYEDHGIKRLVYFAEDWRSVDRLIELIGKDKDEGSQYYLEFMTRDPNEYIPWKADLVASMMRLANPDCNSVFEKNSLVLQYKDDAVVDIAKEQDAEEINKILWSTFHTEISHLLSDDEIREKIKDGQFTIHRDTDNHIDALLQADVMPKKFYINQVANKGEKKIVHAILLKRLDAYVNAGGKYLYAWVEDKNINSLKFHEKYGMKHDGMWSMIYMI